MKNPAMSLWLSAANQAAGWWLGTATSMARRQQQLAMAEMTRAATGKKPARKRKVKPKRRRPS
ncbi:hypothetical protein [Methylobacterium durans]|uniref:Uncharacterized protein n=1 Tax=Methylobacterium durans TaxID=2202825 RepID=A0A2U8WEB1_9HYPH|nr:hypothetical protein [Methylobacterium durans]AWN43646.1 hypothetical protein DK389_27970 [Methylobacterium durans]